MKSASGNVLFLILLAVALFASLSYAVTHSTRSGTADTKAEKLDLDIGVMTSYAAMLRQSVMRLTLGGNCTENQISFYADNWPVGWVFSNSNAPTDKRCDIFSAKGGGAVFERPPQSIQAIGGSQYSITGAIGIGGVGMDGCSQTELLIMSLVPKDMCLRINEKYGISNPSGDAPYTSESEGFGFDNGWPGFSGGYGCGMTIGADIYGPKAIEVAGRQEGCAKFANGRYIFYQVLLAR